MKNIPRTIALAGVLLVLFTACEHPIYMETKVNVDGSLDKVIEMDKADSNRVERNVFNINVAKGWNVDIRRSDGDSTTSRDEFNIRFDKHFASAAAANEELNMVSDTLFRIESKFDKSFRWFYTYIRYSETYKPIDRLKKVKVDDYFNQEDKSFINRLPGEGVAISKADSLYLQTLNEKIFKNYARMGMFFEYFEILTNVATKHLDSSWVHKLYNESDYIYKKLEDMEGEPDFAARIADSLKMPLPKEAALEFSNLSKDLESRIAFMSFARDGKYTNVIEMPWTIVDSNADSVAGNKLYWKPLATKFAIQEYEMFGKARKLNWWTIVVSVAVLGITAYMFIKKNR